MGFRGEDLGALDSSCESHQPSKVNNRGEDLRALDSGLVDLLAVVGHLSSSSLLRSSLDLSDTKVYEP